MLLFLWVSIATIVYAEIKKNDDPLPNPEWSRPSPEDEILEDLTIMAPVLGSTADIGTRRRRDVNEDILDEQAANEIFGSEGRQQSHPNRIGPPAPPPDAAFYDRQMKVLATEQQFETSSSSALFGSFSEARALPPSTNVVPYDSNVDPNFPAQAPRARPLVGEFPNDQVDEQFQTGYRWRTAPTQTLSSYQTSAINQNPSYNVRYGYNSAPVQSYAVYQSPYGLRQAYGYNTQRYYGNYRGRPQYLLG